MPESMNADLHSKYCSIVNRGSNRGVINEDILEFLTVKCPKLATFYVLWTFMIAQTFFINKM